MLINLFKMVIKNSNMLDLEDMGSNIKGSAELMATYPAFSLILGVSELNLRLFN